MGFEYFYGFVGGESDQWKPYLFRDHTQIEPWIGKPGYNLITDMADEAIKYMQGLNAAAPDKPFFLLRARRHARAASTDAGMDREVQGQVRHGLNELREQIFANQKRLGVIPRIPNSPLAGQPAEMGHARRR